MSQLPLIFTLIALANSPYILNYEGKLPTDPDYKDGLISVFLPDTPLASPTPVVGVYRGGNTNQDAVGLTNPQLPGSIFLAAGFIVYRANYPVLDVGDDVQVANDAIARSIQFVRSKAKRFGMDPDRLFVYGRSHGAVRILDVALNEDYRDPHSADKVERYSSRPTAMALRSAPTHMSCFDLLNTPGKLLKITFGADLTTVTSTDLAEQSATHWLSDGWGVREYTPPMFLAYNFAKMTPCSTITDTHDAMFGLVMRDAIRNHSQVTGELSVDATSTLIDSSAYDEVQSHALIALWLMERAQGRPFTEWTLKGGASPDPN